MLTRSTRMPRLYSSICLCALFFPVLCFSTAFSQVIETWRLPNLRAQARLVPSSDSATLWIAHFNDWFLIPENDFDENPPDPGDYILKPLLPPVDLQPSQTTGRFPGDTMQYDFLLLLGRGSESAADYLFISAWYRGPLGIESMFAGAVGIGEWNGEQAWINNVAQMPDSSIVIHVQYAGNDEHCFWGGHQFFRTTPPQKYDSVFSVWWNSSDSIRTYYNADMVNCGPRTMVEITEFLSLDNPEEIGTDVIMKIDSVKSRVVDIWDLVTQHLHGSANNRQQ